MILRLFQYGWYAHPIYSAEGNYPQVMIDRIAERSKKEGFPRSRLPEFTAEEVEYIRGTYDFLSLNHYTTNYAKWSDDYPIGDPSWDSDCSVNIYQDSTWPSSASSWLKQVPWGIRNLLNWINKEFNGPEIVITENGFSDDGTLEDDRRIDYYTVFSSL